MAKQRGVLLISVEEWYDLILSTALFSAMVNAEQPSGEHGQLQESVSVGLAPRSSSMFKQPTAEARRKCNNSWTGKRPVHPYI